MTASVTLKLADGEYGQWTEVSVNRQLDNVSGEFTLALTQQTGQGEAYLKHLLGGERCQVQLHGQTVIDGHVEKVNPHYDSKSHTVSVSGRDLTGALVESSAIIKEQELSNVTIADAATQLLAPFNIDIICPKPGKPFKKFAVNEGESIFETLESHAKQRGQLLYTQADGKLTIGVPDQTDSGIVLKEGVNILAASAERDVSQLHGKYIVKASGKGGQHRQAEAAGDTWIDRAKLIYGERNETASLDVQKRADWEAKTRKGKSKTATITVKSWHVEGKLWQLGTRLMLDAPKLGFEEIMLLKGITFIANKKRGVIAELSLIDPLAYLEL